jgi:hypothetical protein
MGAMITWQSRPGPGRPEKECRGPHDGGHGHEVVATYPKQQGGRLSWTPRWGPWSRRGGELARASRREAFMDPAMGAMVTIRWRAGQSSKAGGFHGPRDGGHGHEEVAIWPEQQGRRLSWTPRWAHGHEEVASWPELQARRLHVPHDGAHGHEKVASWPELQGRWLHVPHDGAMVTKRWRAGTNCNAGGFMYPMMRP